MNKKKRITIIFALLITAATACGPRVEPTPTVDPEEIMAQVAMTIEAEITQNALLTPSATATMPPTATPLPLPTQPLLPAVTQPAAAQILPAESPDNAIWVADVTIPDGTYYLPNARFTKTWKIENTGTTTWDTSYSLIYIYGPIHDEQQLIIPLTKQVKPKEQLEISVPMRAPRNYGAAKTWWQLMNGKGQRFGEQFWVDILVSSEVTVTPNPG